MCKDAKKTSHEGHIFIGQKILLIGGFQTFLVSQNNVTESKNNIFHLVLISKHYIISILIPCSLFDYSILM